MSKAGFLKSAKFRMMNSRRPVFAGAVKLRPVVSRYVLNLWKRQWPRNPYFEEERKRRGRATRVHGWELFAFSNNIRNSEWPFCRNFSPKNDHLAINNHGYTRIFAWSADTWSRRWDIDRLIRCWYRFDTLPAAAGSDLISTSFSCVRDLDFAYTTLRRLCWKNSLLSIMFSNSENVSFSYGRDVEWSSHLIKDKVAKHKKYMLKTFI